MKKRWVSSDGWRGYYEPIPPDGWQVLIDCSIVNDAGIQLKNIVGAWLRKQHIHYKSGYLSTSNVFSTNLYIVIEAGRINAGVAANIAEWFIEENNNTFSIMSGESYKLDIASAQAAFDTIVTQQ